MGESGTGKSSSIRQLPSHETYVINVLDKPLPFKDFKKKYQRGAGGNYYATDNAQTIRNLITSISKHRPAIKNIIIDDFQYIMANAFMRKAKERGFDKFIEIGQSAWEIICEATLARNDLYIFFLSHTEADSNTGRVKCKTIGKMLDEKITLEGMFTVVLHSLIVDNGQYKFLTQNDGVHIAKSPLDMFDRAYIDNDLNYIKQKMAEYIGDCEPEPKPKTELKTHLNSIRDKIFKSELDPILSRHLDRLEIANDLKTLQNNFEAGWKELRGTPFPKDKLHIKKDVMQELKGRYEKLKKQFTEVNGDKKTSSI